MTLQGKKSAGTDLHSKTAQLMGISRDNAKVGEVSTEFCTPENMNLLTFYWKPLESFTIGTIHPQAICPLGQFMADEPKVQIQFK
jgi:hypothetical protein